jgi:hypothetical protein
METDLVSPLQSPGTFHFTNTIEFTVDRPLNEVWPVFSDTRSWYTEYTWEVLSGPPYDSGSRLLEGQLLKVTSSHSFPRTADVGDNSGPEYFLTKMIRSCSAERDCICTVRKRL